MDDPRPSRCVVLLSLDAIDAFGCIEEAAARRPRHGASVCAVYDDSSPLARALVRRAEASTGAAISDPASTQVSGLHEALRGVVELAL
jgi:hypothetical protein